jgi:hypothetical protein
VRVAIVARGVCGIDWRISRDVALRVWGTIGPSGNVDGSKRFVFGIGGRIEVSCVEVTGLQVDTTRRKQRRKNPEREPPAIVRPRVKGPGVAAVSLEGNCMIDHRCRSSSAKRYGRTLFTVIQFQYGLAGKVAADAALWWAHAST